MIEPHDVLRIEPIVLRPEAVERLDAVLRVLAIAAHVPFARRAVLAGHRIRVPHDADDEIALREAAALRRFFDAAERFVADDQPLMAGGRGAVFGGDDLPVGAAHAESNGAHEHGTPVRLGDAKVFELQRVGDAGLNGERAHGMHGVARCAEIAPWAWIVDRGSRIVEDGAAGGRAGALHLGMARTRAPNVIVVMGVAGAGKTLVGKKLAEATGWTFYDADAFHSAKNKAKMHAGHGLTDADRRPWLAALRKQIADVIARRGHAVLACSALKQSYRDALVPRGAPPGSVRFVYLDVSRAVLEQRLEKRVRQHEHFAGPSLLDSQLATLEKPLDALWLDGTRRPSKLVETMREAYQI